MLQQSYFKIFLLFLVTYCLFSCGKDADQQLEIIDLVPEPTEKVYSIIQGLVFNEKDQIIKSAEVFIAEKVAQTDENGFFKLEGFFPLKGTALRVRKGGYFESNGIILPQADGITKVNIILVEKGQTAATETGRAIHHQTEQVSVLFPKDVLVHQDGSIAQGMVSISTQYADPTHQTFAESHPGFLKSKSVTQSEILFPFGILKIDAEDEQARSLSISQEVEITMNVPTDLLAIAPANIAMWYLDVETGLWVQEGTAQLDGATYKGIVTHLSDWVFALGLDYVLLSGQITKEGSPFPFANMGIAYGEGFRFPFNSDEQGNFSYPIIIGGEQYNIDFFKTIDLDVRSNCGTILFEEKNIPPPTMDFTRDIAVQSSLAFTITGQVICTEEDSTVSDAYVILEFDKNKHQEIVPVDDEGKFELVLEECGLSQVALVGYDAINLQRSEPILVSENNATITLNVCEAPFQPKVTFNVDGDEPYIIDNCTVEIIDSITYWHYQFKAIDTFPAIPEAAGQSNEYTIDVFQPKEGEGDVPAQLWRYTQPQPSQSDVPYSIAFGTYTFEILSETEDQVIAQIPLGENVPGNHGTIFRYGGADIYMVKNGSVLLEANK